MKKNYLLLLALLCSFSMFVSCGKDDPAWKSIPPTFEETTTTINGTSVSGTVDFKATGENSGVLTLKNVISGYTDAIKMDVVLKEESENSFTFTGETSLDNPKAKADAVPEPWMLIKANGTVKVNATTGKYELTVNLTTSGWNVVSNIYTGETLAAKVNGKSIEGPVTLLADSESLVDISFESIMNLHNYTISGVTYAKEGEVYKFSGTYNKELNGQKDENAQFTVNGTLSAGVLTLDVTASGWGWISDTYKKDSLSLVMNGTAQAFPLPVKLTASSDREAILTFENLYTPLGANFEMPVTYSYNEADKSYSFNGSKEKEPGLLATVKATLTADYKLEIELNTSGWKKLQYNQYFGKNLIMTYNGKPDTEDICSVGSFKTSSATQAVISVSGPFVVMGEDQSSNIAIPLTLSKDASTETYSFKGDITNIDYDFKATAEGTISPEGVMTISFTYEIKSKVVGQWGVKMNGQMGDVIFNYAGADIAIPDSVYNYVPADIRQIIPQNMTAAQVNQMGNAFLGQYAPQLRTLEFKSDGYVDATVVKVGETGESVVSDILIYYVFRDQLFIFPNLAKLMGGMMSASNMQAKAAQAWDPMSILITGIPLKFTVTGSSMDVVLETETIKGIVTFVQLLVPLLEGALPENVSNIIKAVLGYLNDNDPNNGKVGLLPNTTTLEAGLKLERK